MLLTVESGRPIEATASIRVRCPSCRHRGLFEPIVKHDLQFNTRPKTNPSIVERALTGQRRCPNDECRAHIFFARLGSEAPICYPQETLDFDDSNLPDTVASALSEAVQCHASECYIACAIMVRKTLEELCADRSATGSNLKQRIAYLSGAVVLPSELLSGLDELRLLGNDAAHIESKEFQKVSREEVEVALEVTKEVLKGVYQYSHLVSRLRSLKQPSDN